MPDLMAPIRVLMISKACLMGAYQTKLEEIAAFPDIALIIASNDNEFLLGDYEKQATIWLLKKPAKITEEEDDEK